MSRSVRSVAAEGCDLAGGPANAAAAVTARCVPATDAQRELWVAAAIDADASKAFNLAVALQFGRRPDVGALQAAWSELLDRHDALRSSFDDDGMNLRIRPLIELPIAVEDLQPVAPADRDARREAARRATADAPFDLRRGPLLRATLLLEADRAELLIGVHHSICDGWSLGVLLQGFGALYVARRAGTPAALPPAPSFAAFAADRAGPAGQHGLDAARHYWHAQFEQLPTALALPLDRPRPAAREFASARLDHELDPARLPALRRLAAANGCTLFTLLLGGFCALLHRLGGDRDITVAVPAAEHVASGLEGMVGHCTNLLPLRTTLRPEASFGALVAELQSRVLDAFEHQRLTLGALLQTLAVPRDPARPPLAAVSFNVERDREAAGFGQPVSIELLPRSFDNFELSLNIVVGAGLRFECQYSRSLFDGRTIAHWLQALDCLLQAAADAPQTPLARLALVGEAGMAHLRSLQRAGTLPHEAHACHGTGWLHRLVDDAAAQHPDRPALRACDGALDYRGLVARSNRIAHALRRRGVRAGDRVGVCLPRTIDAVPTLLAVLKAGAAYVPLDPDYPTERLGFMLSDAALRLTVSTGTLHAPLQLSADALLLLDREAASIAAEPAGFEAHEEAGRDPAASTAYIIYTSGSTGRPKGVMVPHLAVSTLVRSFASIFGLRPEHRQLAVVSLSFDISVQDLFQPLSVGAELVLASHDEMRDGAALRRRIEADGITVMEATPTTWRMILQSGFVPPPGFIAYAAGEPMPPELAERLGSGGAEVWNLYGPTETTVHSTWWRVQPRDGGISIGQPIPGSRVWVLDEQRAPCPIGVVGELFIAGDGVALGYLGRPELTAERFTDEPAALTGDAFSPSRMYASGDLGRWCADGLLECAGRRDGQVKLRGHRIELGEIESALARHPAVADCVVVLHGDGDDARLVAYVVACGDGRFEPGPLRESLQRCLPAFMIPQQFMLLAELPLTANGKLDRARLPAPDAGAIALDGADSSPPRSPLERLLHGLWAERLGHCSFGRDDSFFLLGGHSLMAVMLFQRASEATGVNLPLATLYRAPTIAALAASFAAAGSSVSNQPDDTVTTSGEPPAAAAADGDPWRPLVPIRPIEAVDGGQRPLFLMHAVGGNVINYRRLTERLPADIPVYGLQAVGLDGTTPPLASIEAMAQRYIDEILTVQPAGPYRLGGGSMGGVIAFEVACQLLARGQSIASLLMLDSYLPEWMLRTTGRSDSQASLVRRLRDVAGNGAGPAFERVGRGLRERSRRLLDGLRASRYHQLGRPMPHALRYRHVEQVNREAYLRYRPGDYDGPVTLFIARDEPRDDGDRTLGWSAVVGGRIGVVPVPGTHDTLIEQPDLADAIAAALAAATERPATGAERSSRTTDSGAC